MAGIAKFMRCMTCECPRILATRLLTVKLTINDNPSYVVYGQRPEN